MVNDLGRKENLMRRVLMLGVILMLASVTFADYVRDDMSPAQITADYCGVDVMPENYGISFTTTAAPGKKIAPARCPDTPCDGYWEIICTPTARGSCDCSIDYCGY